ncbi:MAG TPA: TolC family protein [Longimicrobiales bacterium]|nr:TolC family protein [Longimicrobiales bacterium]
MSWARRSRGALPLFVFVVVVVIGGAVFLSGLTSAPLAAQDTAAAPGASGLTFGEAVRIALENNPAYMRQLNQVEAAEYGERQSMGQAFLPNLSASLSFGGTGVRSENAVDEFGRRVSGSAQETTSSASQGLSGSVPLFNLQSIRGYRAARARTDAQVAGAALGAAQLRTLVGRSYFDAVQRERLIAVEERNLTTAREQLAATRELLRIAARQPTDVLGAELQVARAEQSLQQARGEARKARLQLLESMGVSLGTELELASDFRAVFDPAALDLDALIDRAVGESPGMGQQEAQLDAARASLSAARAARFPTLNGNFGLGRSTSADEFDAIGQFDLPNQSWNFGFGVSVPLFNRLSTSAQIGQAEQEAENAAESLREARLQLEREVRTAVIDLENAYSGVLVAERAVEISRERLAQGEELYRLGTLGYTDLQRMFDDVAAQERQVVTAQFGFSTALLTLEEKVGGTVGN